VKRKKQPSARIGPSQERTERGAAAHAYDVLAAGRPLKPPPFPGWTDTRSAAALALASEIREGTYRP
jgi:hypothetical protein